MPIYDTESSIETLRLEDDHVGVEERLYKKDEGWVFSFEMTSKHDRPVALRLSVPMPETETILDTGFHPHHEPENWDLAQGVLTFEDVVPGDEPLVFLLGVVMVGDEDFTPTLPEPTIQASQLLDAEADPAPTEAEASIFRSSSLSSSSDFETDETDRLSEDRPESTDAGTDEATGGEDPHAPEDTARPDPEAPVTNEATDQGVGLGGPSVEPTPSIDADSSQPESSGDDDWDDVFGEPVESDISPVVNPAEAEIDVVSALLSQLESADSDDETVEALRSHLSKESSKSTDVRLQHIQSRMDNLAAYTDALEGFIDEHGTAREFVSAVETELEQLRSEVDELRNVVAGAQSAREDLRNQLAAVEASVEGVRQDVEPQLSEMRAEMEELARMRTVLSRAFANVSPERTEERLE